MWFGLLLELQLQTYLRYINNLHYIITATKLHYDSKLIQLNVNFHNGHKQQSPESFIIV